MKKGCVPSGIIRFLGFIMFIGVIVILGMVWPQFDNWIESGTIWPYRADSYRVTYLCGGGKSLNDWASITWINGDHETEIGDYSMPFIVTYTMHYGDQARISARSGTSFNLSCRIDIDNLNWKSAETSGQDVTIESSGIVGHK
jgi:hypothetical protein